MARRSKKKIGEILLEQGVADDAALQAAIAESKDSGKRLGEILVEQGKASEEQVARALAEQYGVEFLDLSKPEVQAKVDRTLVPKDLQDKYKVLPVRKERSTILVCVHDPQDIESLDVIGMKTGGRVDVGAIASRSQILEFMAGSAPAPDLSKNAFGGSLDNSKDLSQDRSQDKSQDKSMDRSLDGDGEDSAIVKFVDRMIYQAVTGRASDIHVEPRKHDVLVRYRVDGVCV